MKQNRRYFKYCWPAQNQLESQIMFYENSSSRDLYRMTGRAGPTFSDRKAFIDLANVNFSRQKCKKSRRRL